MTTPEHNDHAAPHPPHNRVAVHLPYRTALLAWLETLNPHPIDSPRESLATFAELVESWQAWEYEDKPTINAKALAQALVHCLPSKRFTDGRRYAVQPPREGD